MDCSISSYTSILEVTALQLQAHLPHDLPSEQIKTSLHESEWECTEAVNRAWECTGAAYLCLSRHLVYNNNSTIVHSIYTPI